MKKLIVSIAIATSMVALGAEKKAAAAPDKKMKPAPEVAQLKSFEGSWKCDSKMYLPPEMGGEQKTKGTMTIKKDLDGHWLVGEFKMNGTKAMPAMKGKIHWGYDPVDKKFVEMGVDSTGGMFHGTSDGWQGDQIVWNEEALMMGKKSKMKTTVTKTSNKEIIVKAETEAEPGKWVAMGEDRCKKP